MLHCQHTAVIVCESAPFIVNHRQHIVIAVGNIGGVPHPFVRRVILVDGEQIVDDSGEIGIRRRAVEEVEESIIVQVFIFPSDKIFQIAGCAGFRRRQNCDCWISVLNYHCNRNSNRRIDRVIGI